MVLAYYRHSKTIPHWEIRNVSERLRKDPDVVLAAVTSDVTPDALRYLKNYVPSSLLQDRDFMFAAVRRDAMALLFASDELRTDDSFLRKCLEAITDPEPEVINVASDSDEPANSDSDESSESDSDEPAPKRARSETNALKFGVDVAKAAGEICMKVKDERDAERQRADDAQVERDAERQRADDAEERLECRVCQDAETTVCFLPCAHMCACAACADQIMADNRQCPICRTAIQRRANVFLA